MIGLRLRRKTADTHNQLPAWPYEMQAQTCHHGEAERALQGRPRWPYPPVVVIATTYKPDTLAPALLSPGRFDRRIHLSGSFSVHPAAQTKLCLSCKREALSGWKYCIYCGALLVKACPTCGAPHIEVEGARYCFACGSAWRFG